MDKQKACIVTSDQGVMTIRLNRPEDANRINTQAMQIITSAIETADSDPDIKCILLTGDHNNFCCGGRIDPASSPEEKDAYSAAIRNMQQRLMHASVPLIAAIEGNCTAGGNDLLACADIAVAREGVSFGFPEITYGAFPIMVMINTIDLIPKKRLLPYFYTGELFDARTALSYGMLTEVTDEEHFWPTVNRYVSAILKQSPRTLSVGRQTYLSMLPASYDERVALGQKALQQIWKEQAASGKTY